MTDPVTPTQGRRRAKRTQIIRHRDEVQWEFVYAERSEETKQIRAEAAEILYKFGAQHQFFQQKCNSSRAHNRERAPP